MLCPAMKERRMDRIWSVENFDKTSVTQQYPMLERFHIYDIFVRFMTRLTDGSRRRTQRPWPLLARGGGGLVKRR